jgi:hypothetical protein
MVNGRNQGLEVFEALVLQVVSVKTDGGTDPEISVVVGTDGKHKIMTDGTRICGIVKEMPVFISIVPVKPGQGRKPHVSLLVLGDILDVQMG